MTSKLLAATVIVSACLGNSVSLAQDQVVFNKNDKSYIKERIIKTARKYHVSPALVLAIAEVENHFNTTTSSKFAVGPMQIQLNTASDLGYEGNLEQLKDTDVNVEYAVQYIKVCQKKANGNVNGVSCCYNAGQYAKPSVCTSNLKVIRYQEDVGSAYARYSNGAL